jgi:cysteinyl-tRNA synthetase, unknown class
MPATTSLLTSLALLLMLSSCSQPKAPDHQLPTLGYVLQTDQLHPKRKKALTHLSQSQRDWLIIETSFDGSPKNRWTSTELDLLRESHPERKILAYLSIGEAEVYRAYWKKDWLDAQGNPGPQSPKWLDQENPNWKGNFKVRYWNEEWQSLILEELKRIVSTGFDGVYLDIIDAYEHFEYNPSINDWQDHRENEDTGHTFRQDMISWVSRIAQHSRLLQNNFLVFPQNGAALLASPQYRQFIDGIGIEDLLFDQGEPRKNLDELPHLLKLKNEGKDVFLIEYGSHQKLLPYAKSFLKSHGLPILITDRPLTGLGKMISP